MCNALARRHRTYHCGTVPITSTDRAYRVAVVLLPSVGEIAAANATTDAIVRWKPAYVLMVGIAGGVAQDDLDLGDVVVAEQVVGYEYGKVTGNRIKPRDRVYPASALLLERVRNFWDGRWTEQVNVARPKKASRKKPSFFGDGSSLAAAKFVAIDFFLVPIFSVFLTLFFFNGSSPDCPVRYRRFGYLIRRGRFALT